MPKQDQGRGVSLPSSDPANAWSPLEYHAHHRMAELLEEAEHTRLARLARRGRDATGQGSGPAGVPASLAWVRSVLAVLARRMVIHRHGSGAS